MLVSPYNNHAEQSARWRTQAGAVAPALPAEPVGQWRGAAQAGLITLFRTAELRGLNPVDYVETLAKKAIEANYIKPKNMKKAA